MSIMIISNAGLEMQSSLQMPGPVTRTGYQVASSKRCTVVPNAAGSNESESAKLIPFVLAPFQLFLNRRISADLLDAVFFFTTHNTKKQITAKNHLGKFNQEAR